MVSPYAEGVFCSLKSVSPFLWSAFDNKQLVVYLVVIALCTIKPTGEEPTRVELLVFSRLLGKNSTSSGLRVDEYRSSSETSPMFLEGGVGLCGLGERNGWRGEPGKGFGHLTVAPDKTSIEVCKPKETLETLDRSWLRPVHNYPHLGVCFIFATLHNESQESC